MPFQKEQLTKVFEVLGAPTVHDWPNLVTMPDYPQYNELGFQKCAFPVIAFMLYLTSLLQSIQNDGAWGLVEAAQDRLRKGI